MEAKLLSVKQKLAEVKTNDQSWIPVVIPSNIRDKCKATKKIRFDNNKKQWLVKKCDEELFTRQYIPDTNGLTYEEKKVYWDVEATYDKEKDEFYFLKFQLD
jgi:hypothetical protein